MTDDDLLDAALKRGEKRARRRTKVAAMRGGR